MEGVSKTFYSSRRNLTLAFLLGSTEPRSLGWGTGKRKMLGNEGGEVLNVGLQNGGYWGGGLIYTRLNRTEWAKLQRLLIPPVVNWP